MTSAQQASIWTRILLGGIALLGVLFAIGYGMMELVVVILLLAMGGGAVLYWLGRQAKS